MFHLAGEHFELAPSVFVAVFYEDSLDFGVVILEVVLVDGFAVFVNVGFVDVSNDVVVEPVAFVPGSFDEAAFPLGELLDSFRIAGFLLLGAFLAGEPRFLRFLRRAHLCGSPRFPFNVRVDISINYYIRFYCACQAIAVISLVYLIFSFYYSLFDFSHSYLYDNCVLIAAICCRKVKRCRTFIPWLKPWGFSRGFRNIGDIRH